MKTKFSLEIAKLNKQQQASLKIAELIQCVIQKAKESDARYQEGDHAFDTLKKACQAFYSDGNATHESTEYPA